MIRSSSQIIVMVLIAVVCLYTSYPLLRNSAIDRSLSVQLSAFTDKDKTVSVEYKVTYDPSKLGVLKWWAPASVLIDEGAAAHCDVQWRKTDGTIVLATEWADIGCGLAKRNIIAIGAGDSASFKAVNSNDVTDAKAGCRVKVGLMYYVPRDGMSRPIRVIHFNDVELVPHLLEKTSSWLP